MTNEEAIEVLENGAWWDMVSTMSCGRDASVKFHAALDVAITALCAQQTPATLDRSRWEGCYTCNNIPGIMLGEITMCIGKRILTTESHEFKFCPECGRPLTEKAWAELERRINGG